MSAFKALFAGAAGELVVRRCSMGLCIDARQVGEAEGLVAAPAGAAGYSAYQTYEVGDIQKGIWTVLTKQGNPNQAEVRTSTMMEQARSTR